MTITNPLVLPELREALAPLLTSGDLARCARVCKDWHASFLPFLWRTIETTEYSKHPPLESLERHSSSVQHLIHHGHVPNCYLSTQFPALRALYLLNARRCDFEIARNCPSLTHLVLFGMYADTSWAPPASLSNLTSLSLTKVVVRSQVQNVAWNLFSKLESLYLFSSWIPDLPEPMIVNWNMKDLALNSVLGLTPRGQLRWMKHCTHLRRLTWVSSQALNSQVDELVQSVAADTWPDLEELNAPDLRTSDRQISLIIGGMRRVLVLSINYTEPLNLVKAALRPHFACLKILRLKTVTAADDNTNFALEILKSCPQLQSLWMGTVQVRDMLNDNAPWACERSLRHLGICFKVDNNISKIGQQMLLERLSRLHNLDQLDLSSLTSLVQSLDLRLESGMEQLATLTRLEKLTFVGTVQKMKVRDVEWMIKHWKNLKCIRGSLNGHDCVERHGMIARLHEARVETKHW